MFVDINISSTDDTINIANITNENTVCLSISNLIFSFLLSFTIDLYNLKPLTANPNMAGINKIFCINKLININIIPFDIPIIPTHIEIVYPKQNPLYRTTPNTIGKPITVVPKNQIITARITF